ncbi:MAG: phosphate ABC transporter permease PstA [Dehalococcoidia bacterium]|nr:phosphate ABC transporter permease PstA [Dehalococcoidia bacterium]
MALYNSRFNPRLARRKTVGGIFYGVFLAAVMVGIIGLAVLLAQTLIEGLPWLDFGFLTSYMSRHPELAGVKAAVMGTLITIAFTAIFTVPIGVGAAIYLEEYAPKNRLTQIIEVNISNLAGVPSVVYGLLGLGVFVQLMSLGKVVLAGALTLTLLVLPIVILASREAIRAVPNEYRLGAFALGADQWQVIKGTVLPSALPGILTGVGEAAPLLVISGLVYVTFVPGPLDRFTVLPLQIFTWVGRPQEEFRSLAAAGIIVLLIILLSMNAVAVLLRNKYQTRSED